MLYNPLYKIILQEDLHMKYIVVDLEMNKVSKKFKVERELCNSEIIQIGAVVKDENHREISSFSTYVKPRFNTVIDKRIEKLTGITMDMVENAPGFESAFRMFVSFCNSIEGDYKIYQWSTSDRLQILGEMKQKNYDMNETEQKLMEEWIDFQAEFDNYLGYPKQLSLDAAVTYSGMTFEGRQHDALFDARNTAELIDMFYDENRRKVFEPIIDLLKPKSTGCTLGEMFDFSSMIA